MGSLKLPVLIAGVTDSPLTAVRPFARMTVDGTTARPSIHDGETPGGKPLGFLADMLAGGSGAIVRNRAYLAPFIERIATGAAATVIASGDSTTVNDGALPDQLALLLASHNVTIALSGASGQHTGQWRTTWLPGEIAAGPTLLLWGWGLNDLYTPYGRTLGEFEADLRAGLAAYRAARAKDSHAIALLTPNAARDITTGRDETAIATLTGIIATAADDYDCCMIDRFAMYRGADVDATGGGANRWSDGVHPGAAQAQALAGDVYEALVPAFFRSAAGAATFGDPAEGIAAWLAPTAYPQGRVTLSRATGAGWPFAGFVATFMPASTAGSFGMQINWEYLGTPAAGSAVAIRRANLESGVSVWKPWAYLGVTDPVPVTLTPGFATQPATHTLTLHTRLDGGDTVLTGYAVVDAPNPLVAGQVIGQINETRACPDPAHLVPSIQLDAYLGGGADTGAAWERFDAHVSASGQIKVLRATTGAVQRIYANARFPHRTFG